MRSQMLGDLSKEEIIQYLKSVNVESDAYRVERALLSEQKGEQSVSEFLELAYLWKECDFGYIAPDPFLRQPFRAIRSPGTLVGNEILARDKRIDLTIERINRYKYPLSSGPANALLSVQAQHSLGNGSTEVSFSRPFIVEGNSSPALYGTSYLMGLLPPQHGLILKIDLILIYTTIFSPIMKALSSEPVSLGLDLLAATNPTLGILSVFAKLLPMLAVKDEQDKVIHSFEVNLDYESGATGFRLAEGSYVAAQVYRTGTINWKDWVFDASSNNILGKNLIKGKRKQFAYNYVMFRITRHGQD